MYNDGISTFLEKNMLKLYNDGGNKPWSNEFAIACSGGFDSMAIAKFMVNGKRSPTLLHVNHSTGNDHAEIVVREFADNHNLAVKVYKVDPNKKDKSESWEEFWRNERLKFFHSVNMPVITGHNLDDAMETWMFSSMHGVPKLIPYNSKNVYRSFILNRKSSLKEYAEMHNVYWAEDKSNEDVKYSRNRIRHNIMPEILKINPGFDKVILKKYLEKMNKKGN